MVENRYVPWINSVTTLAQQAGAAIRAARTRGIETITKPDGSPQTNADRDAEAIIMTGLYRLAPEFDIVAEESAAGQYIDIARPYWLVDPLDGTKSFVAGEHDFTVNIALVIESRPVFGVIYAPDLEELYWNDPTQAWLQKLDAQAQPIHVREAPAVGLTLITSRRTFTGNQLRDFLRAYRIVEQIMLSGAIKYGYLAQGRADLYPRFGPTMEWDNAAGEAIVVKAGGSVTDAAGAPLRYGQPDLTHRSVIAKGAF